MKAGDHSPALKLFRKFWLRKRCKFWCFIAL